MTKKISHEYMKTEMLQLFKHFKENYEHIEIDNRKINFKTSEFMLRATLSRHMQGKLVRVELGH